MLSVLAALALVPARADADVLDQSNPLPVAASSSEYVIVAPIAQSFTAGVNGRLTRVDFWLHQEATPAPLAVSLYAAGSDGRPTGAVMAQTSIVAAAPTGVGRFTAVFAAPAQVLTGRQYVLVLEDPGAWSPQTYWGAYALTNESYPRGQLLRSVPLTPTPNTDLTFETHVNNADGVPPVTTLHQSDSLENPQFRHFRARSHDFRLHAKGAETSTRSEGCGAARSNPVSKCGGPELAPVTRQRHQARGALVGPCDADGACRTSAT